MYFGSVAGGYANATAQSGEQLANHTYSTFSSKPPTARMITVHAGSSSWRQVANVQPGSALYNDIVRWAETIKARGGTVMVAYNHEPEAAAGGYSGTAAEFIAAWRRVVTHLQPAGCHQRRVDLADDRLRVPRQSRRCPAHRQAGTPVTPGSTTSAPTPTTGTSAARAAASRRARTLGAPVLEFARAHGKKASFPEFASHANAAGAVAAQRPPVPDGQNHDIITAAFYFNRPPTVAANGDCRWSLSTSAEWDAFGDIARDRTHFQP